MSTISLQLVLVLVVGFYCLSLVKGFRCLSHIHTSPSASKVDNALKRDTHILLNRHIQRPALRYTARQTKLFAHGENGVPNEYYKDMDAYQILGVSRTDDFATIKKGFRKAVSTWHPDKFPNDPEKKKEGNARMEKINRAWWCLQDPERKERYDQYGEAGVGQSASSEEQMANGGMGFQMGDMGDLSDLFGQLFGQEGGFGGMGGMGGIDIGDMAGGFGGGFGGGMGGGIGGARGGKRDRRARASASDEEDEDLNVEKEIDFMTSIFGGNEKVRVRRQSACTHCTGTGVKPGAKVKSCGTCGGQGVMNSQQRTPFGMFNNVQACSACRGSGQHVEEYCSPCKGQGTTSEVQDLTIQIPAGVETGAVMRVKEGGHAGKRGKRRGDLFVQLTVKPDKKFVRDGVDILTVEEITYVDAILGTTIKADTVSGKLDLNIPPGTQPGQKLRVRGKGVPRLNSEVRGDAVVTIKVTIPKNISGKEKELVDQLAQVVRRKSGTGFG